MLVKINGILFNPERALRFAPKTICKMDFRPEDVCTLAELEQRCEKMAKLPLTHEVKVVDKMGWRFVILQDCYGNTYPQCFAPISGTLEYLRE